MQVINKKWGEEKVIVNNDLYCGKILTIMPQYQCSVHYHKNKTETFHVIEGSLELEYSLSLDVNDWLNKYKIDKIILHTGDTYDIKPLTAHRFRTANNQSCSFIEFSTHHDDKDSYRIIESQFIPLKYYIDIDETICIHDKNIRDYNTAEPILERIKIINNMYDDGHYIVYWTARGSRSGLNYQELTIQQLDRWGCKRHDVIFGKPSYDIFIDDKAINSKVFFND